MNSINDERGCSVCQPGKENYTTYNTKYKPLSAYRSEVIGNIYDNPNLLKENGHE